MTNIDMTASRQWATRPADERFTSLHALGAKLRHERSISRAYVVSSRAIEFAPDPANTTSGLKVIGSRGEAYDPTHWSFGQLAARAGAPAGYLRSLPSPIAADALNYGFKFARDVEETGLLVRRNGHSEIAAATGPNYGRVWNSDIADQLIDRFGDGVTGDFRVPGEFGQRVAVTPANTTLYASDRDMFVFLADEEHRVTIPNRRDGRSGSLARGFYVSNSEVGASTLVVAMFLFDYVCCNRIIWGMEQKTEIRIRHTSGAPDRWMENALPAIRALSNASAAPIEATLKAAQQAKVDNLDAWLATKRFTKPEITGMKAAFLADEGRDLRDGASLWDVATAGTALARGIEYQNERVDLERRSGAVLDLVSSNKTRELVAA